MISIDWILRISPHQNLYDKSYGKVSRGNCVMRKISSDGIKDEVREIRIVSMRHRFVDEPQIPNHLPGVDCRNSRLHLNCAEGKHMVINHAERKN